ncbi:hypothetical protein [Sphingomonas melonis]|uniref:SOS-response transcriptional repressor LexA n=1 Tax=Sphingomonas melonis TaxID=152682 RepID=A0A7Y9K314_9SPHN|nr:hypothetical protein [Sphingomonas melonis]NYD91412.1 SOS-response transcriptional repressor LexA [Sphingomonas melonis]
MIAAVPRRYEALAFIMQRIVADGCSPSFDEIADELGVGKTRARGLVDELIAEEILDRPVGRQRSFRIRDVARSRNLLVEVLNRLGWTDSVPLGVLDQPCSNEQLQILPPFEHLPDVE